MKKGDLVRWTVDGFTVDTPCIIVRGPREGYFDGKPWTEIIMVVDLFMEGKIVSNVPLSEIQKWVIEST